MMGHYDDIRDSQDDERITQQIECQKNSINSRVEKMTQREQLEYYKLMYRISLDPDFYRKLLSAWSF
jgi:hypothetical protein